MSVFVDKSKQPQDNDLKAVLGNTYVLWKELRRRMASMLVPMSEEWGFSSQKTGWGLRLKREKRIILYMTPKEGYFIASFALGEKAVEVAHKNDLPTSVLKIIDDARKYAEGRGVRLEVKSTEDVRNVEKLAVVKMSN